MKLYVIELLRKDGKPYKRPRFNDFGSPARGLLYADMHSDIRCAERDLADLNFDCIPCRIRTLALLPVEDE